jgi:hypothetical protein
MSAAAAVEIPAAAMPYKLSCQILIRFLLLYIQCIRCISRALIFKHWTKIKKSPVFPAELSKVTDY